MGENLHGGTCCICGGEYEGPGNNPWPVVEDEDARCCDKCNGEKVLIARIRKALAEQAKDKVKVVAVADVSAAAQKLVDAMTAYVNEPDDNEERMKRDEKVYPMVFGVNLLANVLVHGRSTDDTRDLIDRFCMGEEFKDPNTGIPMRKLG